MMDQAELRRHIIASQSDTSLNEEAKAKKRQALLSGRWQTQEPAAEKAKGGKTSLAGYDQLILGSMSHLGECLPKISEESVKISDSGLTGTFGRPPRGDKGRDTEQGRCRACNHVR